jgi:hypothetical protein
MIDLLVKTPTRAKKMIVLLVKTPTRAKKMIVLLVKTPTRAIYDCLVGENTNKG